MKILIISNSCRFVNGFKGELCAALISRGHTVTVAAPFDDTRAGLENIGCKVLDAPVDRRGVNPFKDYKLFKNYKKLITAEAPDAVLTYTVKPNIYGGRAAKKLGVPYFAGVTGLGTGFQKPLLRVILKFLYRRSLKKARAVFFENEGNQAVFTDGKLIKNAQAVLLAGSGVNLEKFCCTPLPEGETTSLLFIGRVMREKGVDEFLSAAKKAKEENLPAEFHMVGDFEENYKEILSALSADGTIFYHGFQKNIKDFITACHAVVLPSYHEGLSNALLEGAAMGRPLITSNIYGCKETVADGISGYLAEKKSAEDLYRKIKQFVLLSPDQKREMGLASRRHIENGFDRNEVNKKTIAVLEGADHE